ncbi:MAG: hypothetical protein WCT23_01295 [Candidatus Neomarinimicrobiota bacterium]
MKKSNSLNHYRLNFRLGMFSFLSHRITGMILVVAGIVMLLGLSVVMFGAFAFDELLITLELPFFVFLAHFLAIVLFWHVLNGIKIILIDVFKLGRIQEILTSLILIAFILGIIFYFIYVFPSSGVA